MFGSLKNLFAGKNNTEEFFAICEGEVIPLDNVNDVAFATEMIGPGVAVKPSSNTIYSPCEGKIMSVFPTLHAVSISSKGGAEILIHVGLDTVKLKGEGFEAFVKEGDEVKKGDKLLEVDFAGIKEKGFDTVIPVILCNSDVMKIVEKNVNAKATTDTVMMTIDKIAK